ncbi:coiled-coil domain-containing protein 15 isoform X7 [Marmota marmota marmota]|uniref:coiled-coil domain-containing protein 15 isoform X7 n=1 Tax=Marmota marmota marmota TaxID=9994 RepID=UPI00209316E3|nr:coiled-coil domain-containing protein 15 isoform X7 [Marmota marmota marmota]
MQGRMAPLKKSQNSTKLPLALNPTKSKDVLAVLAERNQAVIPVGVWVEPASPNSLEIPASTSAHMIEEELKEQLRKKQEALKHFQRQVKHRVNQQIRLKKQQQLQKSFEAAEKEGSIAMQSSDPAHFTPKGTSIFPSNLNAAVGSSGLPASQMFGSAIKDGENQNELFQQQAQALSQTMKQVRHRLASHKTVSKKKSSLFPDGMRKSFSTQQESDSEEVLSIITNEKGRDDLFWGDKQSLFSEDNDKPFSRVQKVKFKNPLFVVIEEKEQKQSHFQGLEAQDYPLETKGDLIEVQSIEPEKSIEPDVQAVDLEVQAIEPECQAIEPEVQAFKTETWSIMIKASSTEIEDRSIELKAQDFLSENQAFLPKCEDQDSLPQNPYVLPKDQNILPKYQDQNFLHKDQDFLPRDQDILPKCQDQDFLPDKDQDFLSRNQHVFPEDQNILHKYQDQDFLHDDQDFLCRDQCVLPKDQNILLKCQDQDFLPKDQYILLSDENLLYKCQEQDFPLKDQKVHFLEPFSDEEGREDFSLHSNYGQASHDMTDEKWRRELLPEYHRYGLHKIQDPGSARDQSLYFRQQPSVGTAERCQEDLLLNHHQHLLPKHQRDTCSRRQVYNDYQSGLNNEFQTPLAFQSGVDKEEDKKERQKQYLRHRRLFMDIEREQVKEQKRQKEQKKKIEKIKKKKEQQRYAEEQKIVRMNFNEEPCSGEKMSGMLAQLQLEELKETREKQQQREKEHIRYVEALRAQVQEKMQLYNITLPPLCCCGPNFWDAHPDTCANNCIFYKNHRAYHRALHSVISSSDISEGNSTLRSAIHNFASAHRRALKNL